MAGFTFCTELYCICLVKKKLVFLTNWWVIIEREDECLCYIMYILYCVLMIIFVCSDIFDAMFPVHRHAGEVIIQQGRTSLLLKSIFFLFQYQETIIIHIESIFMMPQYKLVGIDCLPVYSCRNHCVQKHWVLNKVSKAAMCILNDHIMTMYGLTVVRQLENRKLRNMTKKNTVSSFVKQMQYLICRSNTLNRKR